MQTLSHVLSRPLLAASALVSLAALPAAAQPDAGSIWHSAGSVAPVDAAREPVYGQPASDFSVIVWLDPECPYCKMLGRTPELVVDASGGRVNLAVRLLPLPMHGRAAFIAAATALCVGQQTKPAGYYRFLDRYMELTRTNGAGLPAPAWKRSRRRLVRATCPSLMPACTRPRRSRRWDRNLRPRMPPRSPGHRPLWSVTIATAISS